MSDGSAEGSHDGVADELLHGAAPPREFSSDARVVRPQRGSDVLRIRLIRSGDEANQVDAQDRYDFPLFRQIGERSGEIRRITRFPPDAYGIAGTRVVLLGSLGRDG